MILAVYGKGGLGHEIYELAYRVNLANGCFDEIVFVDDNADCEVDAGTGARVLTFEAATAAYMPSELQFAIGIGEPIIRHELYVKLLDKGYKTATLVHPDVTIPSSSCVEGAISCKYDIVSCNTIIKPNAMVHPCAGIGHNVVIGESCTVSAGCQLGGNVTLGDRAYIGMCTAIKEGISVGKDSVVSMNSSVVRDIPENVIALGNPARPMRSNLDQKVFD